MDCTGGANCSYGYTGSMDGRRLESLGRLRYRTRAMLTLVGKCGWGYTLGWLIRNETREGVRTRKATLPCSRNSLVL